MKISRILWPLMAAAAMCAGYFQMFTYRKIWHAHYPELAAHWANNGSFAVLGAFGTENSCEELAYASRAQNAAWKLLPFDPYIKENRSRRVLVTDYVTYQLMGSARRLIGDINWTWILLRIICCIGWFLVIRRIAWELSKDDGIALFAASFITCFSYLLTFLFVSEWLHSGWAVGPKIWSLLTYGRTESVCRLPRPGLSYGLLFLGQLVLAKAAESRKTSWMFLNSLFGGLLIYIRGDVGMIYLGATFLFSGIYWLRHRSLAPAAWAVATLLLSLPWFRVTFPLNPDFNRLVTHTHSPDWFSVIYLAALATIFKYRRDPLSWSIASILGSVFIILNSRVITGSIVSPFSWRYPANIELFLAALCLAPKLPKIKDSFWRVVATLILGIAFLQSTTFAAIHFPFYGLPGDYDDALAWLNRSSSPDSVVMAIDPEVNGLIPVYTRDKVLLSYPFPNVSDFPIAENTIRLKAILEFLKADRHQFIHDLRGLRPPDRAYLDRADRDRITGSLLMVTYFNNTDYERSLDLLETAPRAEAGSIDADYVWVGPFERRYANPDFARINALKEVYRNGSVVIFARSR